jgi:phosphate transport system protein
VVERQFEHDLEELKQLLLVMAGEAEQQLERAVAAVVQRDSELAEQVVGGDQVLDRRELEVDQRVVELIVRGTPLARDLRLVIAASKIAPGLERIADHAVIIANQALVLNRQPPLKPFITLPRMAETARSMIRDAIAAFVQKDSALAREVIGRDDLVDGMHEEVFRELLTYMISDATTISRALALLLVARSLERIADYATNVAEQVVFVVEGTDIRHRWARERSP